MPLFKQVDVFASSKYKGNPVAVFHDADDLTHEQMAQMSLWTNLSEATFVVKPTVEGADYKVHIFAHEHELPFAGHPTLGTCHALLDAGLIKPKDGKIYQECGAGLVELTVEETGEVSFISFQLPYSKQLPLPKPDKMAQLAKYLFGEKTPSAALSGILLEVGPKWLTVHLDSAETVLSLKPDYNGLKAFSEECGISGVQVIGVHKDKAPGTYEMRTFAPAVGVDEDSACGSGSGAAGAFLGAIGEYEGEVNFIQGTKLSREARLKVNASDVITVGGPSVTTITGTWSA